MTAAAEKKFFKQVLALPRKARLNLLRQLNKSLWEDSEKVSPKEVLAEPTAIYGKGKSKADDAAVSQEEWDKAWKAEIEKRIAEMESGEDPGVSLEVVMEDLRKLSRKR